METKNAAHNSAHHSACRNRKIRSGHETRTFTFLSYVDDNVMRKNLILVSTSDYLSTHENGIYNFSTRQGSEKLVNHRLRTAHRLDEIARLSSRSQSFGYFKRNSLSGAHHILILLHTAYYYLRAFLKSQI